MASLLSTLSICFLYITEHAYGFVSTFPSTRTRTRFTTATYLNGIHEWRDQMFDFVEDDSNLKQLESTMAPPRPINILPFPFDEILLQGETKQLRLYEGRFISLFEDTIENHSGVLAMGLLANAGIVQKVPLCEVEAYNRVDGFGIFVTIRVCGRAELIDIKQQTPYIQAVCREINDNIPPNLELPNLLATQIEDTLEMVTKMETALEEANKTTISRAKLEDRFYEENDNDDEDDDEVHPEIDRLGRYQTAYRIALATDTQGYCVTDSSGGRTPQELTAVSWAAFCTDLIPEAMPTARIQALDTDDLFERLKLASHALKQKESQLKAQLVKAGIDLDESSGGDSEEPNK